MDYLSWNKIISEYFFNEENAGKDVILFVDDNLINNLGASYNANVDDFIEAIKIGPSWTKSDKSICNKAYSTLRLSQASRENYPYYVAFLAFFVLAVDTEGDFIESAYYPRLNIRLGDNSRRNAPPDYFLIEQIWFDLQEWSTVYKREKLGRFLVNHAGPWRHVGIPFSQTILTTEEREQLPIFFSKYNFDPTSIPSADVILKAIIESSIFKKRTKRLTSCKDEDKTYIKNLLIGKIYDSLREWDGTAPESISDKEQEIGWINAAIRLCINIDSLAMQVKVTARLKTNREFPDEELQLIRKKDSSLWVCRESIQNWSIPITSLATKKPLNGGLLDWVNGDLLIDEDKRWIVKLNPSFIRIFIKADTEGFNGYVEVNSIEKGHDYLIACHTHYLKSINEWGKKSCDGYAEFSFEGLPELWHLVKVNKVKEPHVLIEKLQFSGINSISILGGVKTGRGNTYFKAFPPAIQVSGDVESAIIKLNGKILSKAQDNLWHLPDNCETNNPLKIELYIDNKFIASRTIIMEEPCINSSINPVSRDEFGIITDGSNDRFCISGVNIINQKQDIPTYFEQLPTYLSHRIIFIGHDPGQVVEWPDDSILDCDYDVIWAIAKIKRDKWKAYFVGKDVSRSGVSFVKKESSKWKKWKKSLINLSIEPPRVRTLFKLWTDYKREAQKL